MELSASKIPRIEVVDALRGFAVMAIILVHNLEHFIFPVYPTEQPAWLAVLNDGVFNVIFSLFAGKAYAIFALLFGFTFYIQCHNQTKKGKDFGYRFLWRLVLLLGFATLNAAFFPAGDVLLLFAVVGLVLFLVRKWSDKAILITAIILLIQPIEWYHYIMSLLNPAHALPDLGVGAMYSEVAEYTKAGNFLDFIWGNITLGQKSKFVLGYRSRTFSADGRSIPGGTLYRQKRTIRYKRNTPAFLGKGSYYCCNLFRSLVFLKRTDHGKRQCLDQANRRDSFRHVAEICVYIHPRFLVCTLIPERMLQESCFSSAFLR